ncbi:DUF5682 family protein [Kitasatospora sp. NPDC051170]|uniref:vWA domain-containing protein n=1 Tax=Kitasatospora sp. NPDC051170 TaxID=3364056 RepID=UPI0037926D03
MTVSSSAVTPAPTPPPAPTGGAAPTGGTEGADQAAVTAATDRLAASGSGRPGPYLIGVRHHAPSLSAVLPALLEAARPETVLIELPAEFQPWLDHLADERTTAPVALAAAPASGDETAGPAFYPFADFSPELVALRWARRNGVPAVACDLPLAHRAARTPGPGPGPRPGLGDALRRRLTGRASDEDLWDRLVETAAPGSTPEAVRRAALLVGWALRHDAENGPGVDPYDEQREAWMRARIQEATAGGRRAAVVIGAFHAPALLEGPVAKEQAPETSDVPETPDARDAADQGEPSHVLSLIPYTYPLLDARSGYPAGIRDPEWQHTVLDAAADPRRLHDALTDTAVRICAALRADDHPSGPADAREIVRLTGDLARLRGHAAPGRGELIEAVQTVLAQGEPLGRGRAVARALERVLIGTRTGRPTPAAPRSGLAPAVEARLAELGLPGPEDPGPRELRLDSQRSALDRRREILFHRLTACAVPYADPVPSTGAGGLETLGTRWRLHWTPATAAMLTVASTRGVTPAQAAEGALRARLTDQPTPGEIIEGLTAAASCALPALATTRLTQLTTALPTTATLPDLLAALTLLDRLTASHLPLDPAAFTPPDTAPGTAPDTSAPGGPLAAAVEVLTVAAVRQVEGVAGSDEPGDARALVELARRADLRGGVRLAHLLAELADRGSPLVRGAAGAVRVLLGQERAEVLGGRAASWVDGAAGPEARRVLGRSLVGLLTAAEGLFDSAPEALEPLLERVGSLADDAFLARLPALRGGFDTLSPAARDRLLTLVEERLGTRLTDLPEEVGPAVVAGWVRADLAARAALARQGLLPQREDTAPETRTAQPPRPNTPIPIPTPTAPAATPHDAAHALAPAERWRLLLGRPGGAAPQGRGARLAAALDELYGSGHGEGSGPGLDSRGGNRGGNRGGREAPYPGVREWAEELESLFGPGVREEVLAAAVERGRTDVIEAIDPASVQPSVDLLRTVLDHAGGMPEARLANLRPLVRRLVDELSRELATRLRPALTGIAVPRPSRRPGGGLDLDRTIRANLATARPGPDGGTLIVPERPVFRTRARQANDWRLVLVVDVSGSMEASTVWAALTAAILAGVPSLSTHFVAFSTEVVDLTERVADPLSLLLEVRVGGGTSIATGLRYARELVTVPSRTLVAVISDFEEGGPLGPLLTQTRALVDSGVQLLGCASLDDTGTARYSKAVAGQLVAAGMPVAALSPLELARWVGEKVR